MINEYIRYRIAADRSAAFLDAYRAAEPLLQGAPECLGYELSRCTEDPEHFVLKIQWESEKAHLEGFRKGPSFPPFLALVKPFLAEVEEMRHYQLTGMTWRRTAP